MVENLLPPNAEEALGISRSRVCRPSKFGTKTVSQRSGSRKPTNAASISKRCHSSSYGTKTAGISTRYRLSTPKARQPENIILAFTGCSGTTQHRPACTGRSERAAGFIITRRSRETNRLPVTVFLGGPPALIISAIAPLPEDVPELMLASLLADGKIGTDDNPHRSGSSSFIAECRICDLSVMCRRTNENPKGRSVIITVTIRWLTTIPSSMPTPYFIERTRSIRRRSSASRVRKISLSAIIYRNSSRRCFRS